MLEEVLLPELGEGVIEATISEVYVDKGEEVAVGQKLVEVETDKVTTDLESTHSGVVDSLGVSAGEMVEVGHCLLKLEVEKEPLSAPEPQTNSDHSSDNQAPIEKSEKLDTHLSGSETETQGSDARVIASPIARRLAAENGIDIAQVVGTGIDGQIKRGDVENAINALSLASDPGEGQPNGDVSTKPEKIDSGNDEVVPHSTVRRSIAEHMVQSRKVSPHAVTLFDVEFTNVMKHRGEYKDKFKEQALNLTITSYLISAVAAALQEHPKLNSQWSEDGLVLKNEINLGVAIAVEQGLFVPVIANADTLSLSGVASKLQDYVLKARSGELTAKESQGGTFSITNHGVTGSILATPIIHQPQCAIIGFGAIEKRVVVQTVDDVDVTAIKPMGYMSLAFDHRIIDGAEADAFMTDVKHNLQAWGT